VSALGPSGRDEPPLGPPTERGISRAIDEGLLLEGLEEIVHRPILVATASRHGATREIGDVIAAALRSRGSAAESADAAAVDDVEPYAAVVLGSAVYGGHWLEDALALARRRRAALLERPVWLFSSGPIGDPRRRLVRWMGADPVDLPELVRLVDPVEHRMLPGRLLGADVGRVQRMALRLARLEGDFRNWPAVEAYAAAIAAAVTVGR